MIKRIYRKLTSKRRQEAAIDEAERIMREAQERRVLEEAAARQRRMASIPPPIFVGYAAAVALQIFKNRMRRK